MKQTTAANVMTKKVQSVSPKMPLSALIQKLKKTKFSGFPVVDGKRKVVGLISQNDILRALAHGTKGFQKGKRKASTGLLKGPAVNAEALLSQPVRALMTPRTITCQPETPLSGVCSLMAKNRIHRVVVVNKKKQIVGLVSATDVLRWIAKSRS